MSIKDKLANKQGTPRTVPQQPAAGTKTLADIPSTNKKPSTKGSVIPADFWAYPNGLLCSVCNEPQYHTGGGACCKNGHGGAEGYDGGGLEDPDANPVSPFPEDGPRPPELTEDQEIMASLHSITAGHSVKITKNYNSYASDFQAVACLTGDPDQVVKLQKWTRTQCLKSLQDLLSELEAT